MPEPLGAITNKPEKFLLYGDGGSGKTFAAGTMPSPVYFIVVGSRDELDTLRSPAFRKKHPKQIILQDCVVENRGPRGTFKAATAFDRIGDLLDEAFEKRDKGEVEFNSLVLDNATQLSDVAMNKAIEINFGRASQDAQMTSALKRLQDNGILVPADVDYGSEMSLVRKLVTWCTEQDVHFCLTAHTWESTKAKRGSRETTLLSRKPLFIGQNRNHIPNLFSNVWYMNSKGGHKAKVYEALTQGDDITEAKTRLGDIIPINYRDVNLTQVIEKYHNHTP